MPGEGKRFDRRTALKMIGSTAMAGVGLGAAAGTGAAYETLNRLERGYSSERRLRIAFQQHGEGLRQTLVDEGVVPEDFDFGTLEFGIDANVNGLEPTARDGLAGVTAVEQDGVQTALGVVSTSTDTHDIVLFVQPERDDAYALVEPKDGDEQILVTESNVGPTSECQWTECTSTCCDDCKTYEEEWGCVVDGSGNCTDCRIVDTYCGCWDSACGANDLCPEASG